MCMRARKSRLVVATATLSFAAATPFLADRANVLAADPPKDAGPDAKISSPISHIPPDPAPMRERAQWIFDLRWAKGDVYLLGVHKMDLAAPQETPRAMGRFALELFEGPTLIERVRFDFPLLGDEARDAGGVRPVPYFGKNLTTRIGVMFPASVRGNRLQLWDRAIDKRWDLPWPPEDTRDGGIADGGVAR